MAIWPCAAGSPIRAYHPALAEIQYCYVNGQMMRDRLINHAILPGLGQAGGRSSNRRLYLEIDPHQVDVNVRRPSMRCVFISRAGARLYLPGRTEHAAAATRRWRKKTTRRRRARCRRTASPRRRNQDCRRQKRKARRPALPLRHLTPHPAWACRSAFIVTRRRGSWRMRSRVTRSSRERFIVNCSTRQQRQSQRCSLRRQQSWPVTVDFRVAAIDSGDCALLEREGGLALRCR